MTVKVRDVVDVVDKAQQLSAGCSGSVMRLAGFSNFRCISKRMLLSKPVRPLFFLQS